MLKLFEEEGTDFRKEKTYLLESREPGLGDSDTESYYLDTLPSKVSIPIDLNVSLNGAKTTMVLNTCASHSIISESTYWKLRNSNPPVIKGSSIDIQTYTGERLKILGKI